jgi:hypothetical protein
VHHKAYGACHKRRPSKLQTETLYGTAFVFGKTGVRNCTDKIDILSTYLTLFPPIHDTYIYELINEDKQAILYDALPHYYLKNIGS